MHGVKQNYFICKPLCKKLHIELFRAAAPEPGMRPEGTLRTKSRRYLIPKTRKSRAACTTAIPIAIGHER